ncbi:MAG: hypothetical protein ACR2PX_03155 [Endozoicomonas sp.]|uniref:hypothetical protein n=1 Tax=Endozoicomonas sp. TaxID=1892382 RepID=UPI003D9B62A4
MDMFVIARVFENRLVLFLLFSALFSNCVAAYEVCPHCKLPMVPTGLNQYECHNSRCPGPDGGVQSTPPMEGEVHPQCGDCTMPTLAGVCHYSGCLGKVVSKNAVNHRGSPTSKEGRSETPIPAAGPERDISDEVPVQDHPLVKLSFSDFMMVLPPEDRHKFDPFSEVSSSDFLAALRQILGFTLPIAALTAMIYTISKAAGLFQLSFSMVNAVASVSDPSRKTYLRRLAKDFAQFCQSRPGGSVQDFAEAHASDHSLGECLSESSESGMEMANSLEIHLHEGNTVFLILDLPDTHLYLLLTPEFDEVGLENVIVTSQFVEEMKVDGWQISSFLDFLWSQLSSGDSGSRMLAILSQRTIETSTAETKRR